MSDISDPMADEPAIRSLLARTARTLGWTTGQVWTVAIGLSIAVPAAIFGLGPTLDQPTGSAAASAPVSVPAPDPQVADDGPPGTEPSPPPASPSPAGDAAPGSGPAAPTAPVGRSSDGVPERTSDPGPLPGSARIRQLAGINGSGDVRAIAVADDVVAVAVDEGPGAPGRLVVVDMSGDIASDVELEIGDVAYEAPGGVAVADESFLVTTTSPAAVLRIDTVTGEVTKVADVPDVAVCLPLASTTNCQPTVPDTAANPRHLAVTERGDIYVADQGQACIHRVAQGEDRARTWLCDLSFAASPTAPDGGLAGLAWAPGRLVYTVAAGIDGTDSVHEVEVRDRGPGERGQLAEGPDGGGANGLTILSDGRVVVALTHADALLVIDAQGPDSAVVAVDGVPGPADVEVVGETLFIAHGSDRGAGSVSRGPVESL